MKNWNEADYGRQLPLGSRRRRCARGLRGVGHPLNTVDLVTDYWERVFADFLASTRADAYPIPMCCAIGRIKFKAFLESRARAGRRFHRDRALRPARRGRDRPDPREGRRSGQDQSYFLYTLGQAELAASLFPLGGLHKHEVRALARAASLPTHEKKDSTGICFIGERRFREFLARYVAARPGPVVTTAGRRIGTHHGAVFYTLGQRQGLGIGGVRGAAEAPWFVAAKDLERNELTVVQGHDHPALMSTTLVADNLSWVRGAPPATPGTYAAKTRYRQPDQRCVIARIADGQAEVHFSVPQRAVTPGQSVVFYDGATCLGGGIIARRLRPDASVIEAAIADNAARTRCSHSDGLTEHDEQLIRRPHGSRSATRPTKSWRPPQGPLPRRPPALRAENPAGEPVALRGRHQRHA